jgi:hypothetical protein
MLLGELINAPWQPSGMDGDEASTDPAPGEEPTHDAHGAAEDHPPAGDAHAAEPHDEGGGDHGGH